MEVIFPRDNTMKCDARKCPNAPIYAIRQKQLGRKGTMRTLYYCKECAPPWAPSGSTKFYDVTPISGGQP